MIEFLILALAFAIVLVLWKSRSNYLALPALPLTNSDRNLDLTVVIPARNEAHRIARAVKSFPKIPVLVVDDSSTDETAAAARAAGALVISAPPLAPASKGKPNACAAGARLAQSKWILFVDADTWFEPAFAPSIVSYAEKNDLQVVTAFLEQICVTLPERILLPYAFALYFTGVSARAVNSPKSPQALANGQCLLFERSAYESIGGHTSVLTSVIEDVSLARLAKRRGLSLRVVRAERLGHVRMYDSFSAIWQGFQKNSFRFLLINPWSGIQVVIASILLTSWLPMLLAGLRDYPNFSPQLLLTPTPLTLLFLAPFFSLLPWYRGLHTVNSWRVVFAPLAIYLFQLIALNGMLVTLAGRRTIWKGRRV